MESPTDEQYRKDQEEFISNHGGSSPIDVILLILSSILAITLSHNVSLKWGRNLSPNMQTFIEFLITVLPGIFCCTIFSEYTGLLCILLIISSSLIFRTCPIIKDLRIETSGRLPFLTHFRALTNILTAICILAVDFRIFPRKFAKTEVYGYSLMDTGVGLFIMANALVAPEARALMDKPRTSLFERFTENARVCTRGSAPLLILGFGRFLAVEYSGYQTHVSEYGVHWNFFVTLAFVKIFTSTIASAISCRYAGVAGLWIIGMHEYALSTNGLKQWVLGDTPRDDFVSANREGLVSVPGYVGLYLIGIAVGRIIHMANSNKRRPLSAFSAKEAGLECNTGVFTLISKLVILTGINWAATSFCESRFEVSRRLTNAGYCFWMVTLSCIIILAMIAVDINMDISTQFIIRKTRTVRSENRRVKFESKTNKDRKGEVVRLTPEIFEAVNYNGLVFFLLANLMTGFVNMNLRTLYVGSVHAMVIIVSYMATIILISVIMYRYKVQLKL